MPEVGALYFRLQAKADGVEQTIRKVEAQTAASAERQTKAAQDASAKAAKAAEEASAAAVAASAKAEAAAVGLAKVQEEQAREAAKVQTAEAKRVADATVAAKKEEADAARRTAKAAEDAAGSAAARARTAADTEARAVEQGEARKLKATQDAESRRAQLQIAGAERTVRAQERLSAMGASLSLKASIPIAVGFAAMVKGAASFEQASAVMAQQSGASVAQMAQVSAKARELGADLTLPATSARDAMKAMLELSKAGLTLKDTMAASRGVLQLSAAAQIDNAKAAEITANGLNAFKLSGDQAIKVADYLANAANKSSASITQIAEAFQAGAAVANMAGLSITEYTASLGLMANAGIKGSDAGTSIKSMLAALLSPTDKAKQSMQALGVSLVDSSGKIRPFQSILADLGGALQKLPQGKKFDVMGNIVGTDGIRALEILTRTPGELAKMEVSVKKQGAAADAAKAQNAGLKGAVDAFGSSADTLGTTLGTRLLPKLTEATKWATHGVEAFAKLPEPVQNTGLAVLGLVAVLGPALSIASKIIGLRAAWVTAMGAKATATTVAALAQERLNVAEAQGAGAKPGGVIGGLAKGTVVAGVAAVGLGLLSNGSSAGVIDDRNARIERDMRKTLEYRNAEILYRKKGAGAASSYLGGAMPEAQLFQGMYRNARQFFSLVDSDVKRLRNAAAAQREKSYAAGEEHRFSADARYREAEAARAKAAAGLRTAQAQASAAAGFDANVAAQKEAAKAAKRAARQASGVGSRAGSSRYTSTYGGSQANAIAAGHEVEAKFGVHEIGGRATDGHMENSLHYQGRALDIMTRNDRAKGQRIADFGVANAQRLGISQVIFNDRINTFDKRGWRPYTDKHGNLYKDDTKAHRDHPHFSFVKGRGPGKSDPSGSSSRGSESSFGHALDPMKDARKESDHLADQASQGFAKLRESLASATDGRARYAAAMGLSLNEYKRLAPAEQSAARRLVEQSEAQERATKASGEHKAAMSGLAREAARIARGGKEDPRDAIAFERFGKSFADLQKGAGKATEAAKIGAAGVAKAVAGGLDAQKALATGTAVALGLFGVRVEATTVSSVRAAKASREYAEHLARQKAMTQGLTIALGLYGVALDDVAARAGARGAKLGGAAGGKPALSFQAQAVADIEAEVAASRRNEAAADIASVRNAATLKRLAEGVAYGFGGKKGFRGLDSERYSRVMQGAAEYAKAVNDLNRSLDEEARRGIVLTNVETTRQALTKQGIALDNARSRSVLAKAEAFDKEAAKEREAGIALSRRAQDRSYRDSLGSLRAQGDGSGELARARRLRDMGAELAQTGSVQTLPGAFGAANVAVGAFGTGLLRAKQYLRLEREVAQVNHLRDAFTEAARGMEGGFKDALSGLVTGDFPSFFGSVGGMLDGFARRFGEGFLNDQIGRWTAGLTRQMTPGGGSGFMPGETGGMPNGLLGAFGGGLGGLIGSLGGLFGGHKSGGAYKDAAGLATLGLLGGMRERGGPVRQGVPYLVGERRAEIFVPERDGSILPNAGAGASGHTYNITINMTGGSDEGSYRNSAAQIRKAVFDAIADGQRRNG